MNVPKCTRLLNLRNVVNAVSNFSTVNRLYAAEIDEKYRVNFEDNNVGQKKLGKAMKMYLDRALEHDEFMRKELAQYEVGKRRLAKMMGEDPDSFTQADITKSIQYLFPSGLFEPLARPIMKHPSEIYSTRKAAEFDESGRPFDSLFYTDKPNYYQALHKIVAQLNTLNKLEDEQAGSGTPYSKNNMHMAGSIWITKDELQDLLLESISDNKYQYFVTTLERLLNHPYSSHASQFLMKYRKTRTNQSKEVLLLPVQYDVSGRPYVTATRCQKKTSTGEVTVWGNGSGNITINGEDMLTFTDVQCREQIIFPLIFVGMADKVDIEATITGGGPSSQACAIRWGISWALRSFVDQNMIEKMRIAGLLTRDWRRRERKKFGQEGARRKFTWKKR